MTHFLRVCNGHTIRAKTKLDHLQRPAKAAKIRLLVLGSVALIGLAACQGEGPPATNETADNSQTSVGAIEEADRLYVAREDLMKVRQGLVTLRRRAMVDGGNYDIAWRLARLNYYLGSHTTDSAEREKAFREGIQAGKLAVQLQDGKPDGHFWLGANYGGSAQDSTLAGLSEVEDIRREMDTVIKLDSNYQAGSAYMVMGQTYLQAPMLLGGDRYKAVEYLEKSVQIGPTNALAHIHLAEAYLAVNKKDDAQKQLATLIAMKPNPDFIPEHNEALVEARKLQAQLN
jgi:tetratricopeptide (TPR) repeat protein